MLKNDLLTYNRILSPKFSNKIMYEDQSGEFAIIGSNWGLKGQRSSFTALNLLCRS